MATPLPQGLQLSIIAPRRPGYQEPFFMLRSALMVAHVADVDGRTYVVPSMFVWSSVRVDECLTHIYTAATRLDTAPRCLQTPYEGLSRKACYDEEPEA